MGYAMDFLIPAAIMYANPGLTREEYAEVLRQIRFPASRLMIEDFEYVGGEYASSDYKAGLFSVARILGLEPTQEYKEFSKPVKDEKGLNVYAPSIRPIVRPIVGAFLEPMYKVTLHLQNKVTVPKKKVEVWRHVSNKNEKFKPQEIIDMEFYQSMDSSANWQILEVLDQDFCPTELDETGFPIDFDDYGMPGDMFHAHLRVLEFIREFDEVTFPDLDSLTAAYPMLHPDQIWDWSQEKGDISLSNVFLSDRRKDGGVHWIMKNRRYYIDFSSRVSEKIYTSLRVTMAAIKQGAMGAFGHQPSDGHYWPKLKTNFPEIRQENNDAVVDYWTSRRAIQTGSSISEWLRKNIMLISRSGEKSLRDTQIMKRGRYH